MRAVVNHGARPPVVYIQLLARREPAVERRGPSVAPRAGKSADLDLRAQLRRKGDVGEREQGRRRRAGPHPRLSVGCVGNSCDVHGRGVGHPQIVRHLGGDQFRVVLAVAERDVLPGPVLRTRRGAERQKQHCTQPHTFFLLISSLVFVNLRRAETPSILDSYSFARIQAIPGRSKGLQLET